MAGPSPPALPLRRRLRRLRIEAAVTNLGTAVSGGLVVVVATAAYVLGRRGAIAPDAWLIGLGVGLAVVATKAVADLLDRDDEPTLMRHALVQAFGDSIANDPDLTRMARQGIEQRVRLSQAQARAPGPVARALDPVLAEMDSWLDQLIALARLVARHRTDARFHSGMATLARQRLSSMEARTFDAGTMAIAPRLRQTAGGLAAQLEASGDFTAHVEGLTLQLEHGLSELGAASARIMLAVSQGDIAAAVGIRRQIEAARKETELAMTARTAAAPEM